MNKMSLYFLLFMSFCNNLFSQETLTNCDTIIIDSVKNVNYNRYVGEKIRKFILDKYVRKFDSYFFGQEPPTKYYGLLFFLNGNTNFEVILDFEGMKKINDIVRSPKSKKERLYECLDLKIERIIFYYDHKKILDTAND